MTIWATGGRYTRAKNGLSRKRWHVASLKGRGWVHSFGASCTTTSCTWTCLHTELFLVSVPPIDFSSEERKETFQLHKELTCLTDLQEIARAKEAIGKDGRHRLVEKWQTRWHGDQSGRWTHRLIPELATWLDRKHGQVGFYLPQALSGHGCFNAYLKRFEKRDDGSCSYCGYLVDNAEHILFVYAGQWAHNSLLTRWSLSCFSLNRYGCLSSHSSPWWWRRGSSMGVQSAPTTGASRNCIGACTRGEESLFLPWLARLVGLPNRRVPAGGSLGRTDDGRVVRDFKLEPTACEV